MTELLHLHIFYTAKCCRYINNRRKFLYTNDLKEHDIRRTLYVLCIIKTAHIKHYNNRHTKSAWHFIAFFVYFFIFTKKWIENKSTKCALRSRAFPLFRFTFSFTLHEKCSPASLKTSNNIVILKF